VWGSDAAHVWTCGFGGEIRFFNGSTWTGQASGTGQLLVTIAGRSDSDVFAVGTGGTILHWNGFSWASQASGTTEVLFKVCVLPGGSAWAVGWNGTVLRHDGTTWSPEAVGLTTAKLSAVWASSDTDVWIGGQSTTIWHGDGSSWTPMNPGSSFLVGAWGSSPTDVYFGSFSGVVHWDGSSFERQVFSSLNVNEIFGTSPTNIFATGGESTIGHFDGTEWLPQANPGEATNPTLRIGEYNGVAGGPVAVATWVGNTLDASLQPVAQQSLFDSFTMLHQVGAPELQPLASLVLLEPGRPNPFRWVTTISYALPTEAPVRLSVHDAGGRLVRELDSGARTAGRHEVTWDGRDGSGNAVAAGVYFVRLDGGRQSRTSKLVLVR